MHRATAGDYAYYQEDWVRDELYQEADQNARQPHPETYRSHEMEMLSQESEEQFHHSRVETLPSDFNDSEIQYQEAYCLPHRNIYFAPPTPSACSLDLDLLIGSWADEPVHKQHSTEKTAIKSCEESRIDKGNRSSTQNKGTSTRSSIRSIVKSKRIHSHESSRSSSSTESISRPNLNRQSTSPRRSYASQPAQPNDWPDVVRGDSHMRPSTYYPFYNQEPGALVPRLRVEQKDSSDNYTRHVSFRARPE
ncbi:hypothetical protein B0O99DRAFT_626811 [Bisporella sp. PMI_857]|nr:hypothetical protein B0O99DRAFT_626811 [Bisporella sp. PMI_857]